MSHYRDIAQLANENVDVRTVDYFLGSRPALIAATLEPEDVDFIGLSARPVATKSGNRVIHIGGGHYLTLVGPSDTAVVTDEFLV